MINPWNRVMTNLSIACGSGIKITSTVDQTPDKFPAVAVIQIDDRDAAVDMENSENGVQSVIHIDTFSNKSLTEARSVADTVCDAMRTMGYRRTLGPRPILNAADTKILRTHTRFSRFVGDVNSDIPKFNT